MDAARVWAGVAVAVALVLLPEARPQTADAADAKALLESWVAQPASADRDRIEAQIVALGAAAVPALQAAVEESGATMGVALVALCRIGEPARPALPRIVAILRDREFMEPLLPPRSPKVRESLCLAARDAGWAAAELAPVLGAIAADARETESLRVHATIALGSMGVAALSPLAALLEDEQVAEGVRHWTLHALEKIGAPAAPLLRAVAERDGHPLQDRARAALSTAQEAVGGPTRGAYYGALVDAHPFDPRVVGWLGIAQHAERTFGRDARTVATLARWRAALREKPDAELAWNLALLIQEQLRHADLDPAHGHGYRGKAIATENDATLAAALRAAQELAEPLSPRAQQCARGLARIAWRRGDWEAMNAALVEARQAPVPAERRPWLPLPPESWGNLADVWQPCDESLRSGDCAFEVRVEKEGRGLRGVHVLVRPMPSERNSYSTGIDPVSLFHASLPLDGGSMEDRSRKGAARRAPSRWAVTDDSGVARLEGLPAIEITAEILIPTAIFEEPGTIWDAWRRAPSGELELCGYRWREGFQLVAGETVQGPDLAVRPRLALSVGDGAAWSARDAAIEWNAPAVAAATGTLRYEIELALSFPSSGQAVFSNDQLPCLTTATATSDDTRWPLGEKGVGSLRLVPGNLYTVQVVAKDAAGGVVARSARTWGFVPWDGRASDPPRISDVWSDPGDEFLPIEPETWCRGEFHRQPPGGGTPRVEDLPQALARWQRDHPDSFERDYVEVVQAWLQWRAGDAKAARERLAALAGALPASCIVAATATDLVRRIDASESPREQLNFLPGG